MNLDEKVSELHDRIEARLFDEEWERRKVKHKPKPKLFKMTEAEIQYAKAMQAIQEQETVRNQYLHLQQSGFPVAMANLANATLQSHYPRYAFPSIGVPFQGLWGGLFGFNPLTKPYKCPYCGK